MRFSLSGCNDKGTFPDNLSDSRRASGRPGAEGCVDTRSGQARESSETVPRSRVARLRRGARLSCRTIAHEPRALRAIANCKVTPAGPTTTSGTNQATFTKMLNARGSDPRSPPKAGSAATGRQDCRRQVRLLGLIADSCAQRKPHRRDRWRAIPVHRASADARRDRKLSSRTPLTPPGGVSYSATCAVMRRIQSARSSDQRSQLATANVNVSLRLDLDREREPAFTAENCSLFRPLLEWHRVCSLLG